MINDSRFPRVGRVVGEEKRASTSTVQTRHLMDLQTTATTGMFVKAFLCAWSRRDARDGGSCHDTTGFVKRSGIRELSEERAAAAARNHAMTSWPFSVAKNASRNSTFWSCSEVLCAYIGYVQKVFRKMVTNWFFENYWMCYLISLQCGDNSDTTFL